MNRTHARPNCGVAVLAVTLAMVAVTGGLVVGTSAANHDGDDGPETFTVAQPDACYEVTPHGDGTVPVDQFYDYRVEHGYSSHGTDSLQEDGVSNLFLYHGPEGVSLVFLHGAHENDTAGGTVSMTVTGLPADSEWVVEDDDYPDRDDEFDHGATRSDIDWRWRSGRTDGGAVRGMETNWTAVVVAPAFNDASPAWTDWPYADGTNRIDTWRIPTPAGETAAELDPSDPVVVAAGTCDVTGPYPGLAVDTSTIEQGESVTLDADTTTSAVAVQQYRWDLDGDGEVDRVTREPTVTHAYDAAGTVRPTVEVVDATWNTATASVEVTVLDQPETPDPEPDTPVDDETTTEATSEQTEDVAGAQETTTEQTEDAASAQASIPFDVKSLLQLSGAGERETAEDTPRRGPHPPTPSTAPAEAAPDRSLAAAERRQTLSLRSVIGAGLTAMLVVLAAALATRRW